MNSLQFSILIIVSIVLLFLSSFFSAAETAYSSINKFTIEQKLAKNKKSTLLIKKHYKTIGWILATILLGNNIVNIALSSITTLLFAHYFIGNNTLIALISTLAITPIVVVFGEIIPKLLAKKYPYKYLSKVVYVLHFLSLILFPITYPFSKLVLSSKVNITEKEIKDIARLAAKQKEINMDEALLVGRSLELNSLDLHQIMTPKINFIDVNVNDSIHHTLSTFNKSGHSRLPVIEKGRYIGVIFLKDIFLQQNGNIRDYVVKIPILSKNMSVTKALEILRTKKTHIAYIATISKKSIIGLITLEDIIEEIFGEIYDEHDVIKPINQIGPNKWIVDGHILMLKIAHLFQNINFGNVSNLTVKKWFQSRINKKIKVNYKYNYQNKIIFRVILNKKNGITKFEIRKKWK